MPYKEFTLLYTQFTTCGPVARIALVSIAAKKDEQNTSTLSCPTEPQGVSNAFKALLAEKDELVLVATAARILAGNKNMNISRSIVQQKIHDVNF